ncbi:MAG: hypothetical protein KDK99_16575 [Verrucomicrobiales bacterium]|nr:hypothetical protein [Verrucomicrobiales bacterium]
MRALLASLFLLSSAQAALAGGYFGASYLSHECPVNATYVFVKRWVYFNPDTQTYTNASWSSSGQVSEYHQAGTTYQAWGDQGYATTAIYRQWGVKNLNSGEILVIYVETARADSSEPAQGAPPNANGEPDWDTDGDGVRDSVDAFPNNPAETTDSDGDGVGDNGDTAPNDPTKWGPGDGQTGDGTPTDLGGYVNHLAITNSDPTAVDVLVVGTDENGDVVYQRLVHVPPGETVDVTVVWSGPLTLEGTIVGGDGTGGVSSDWDGERIQNMNPEVPFDRLTTQRGPLGELPPLTPNTRPGDAEGNADARTQDIVDAVDRNTVAARQGDDAELDKLSEINDGINNLASAMGADGSAGSGNDPFPSFDHASLLTKVATVMADLQGLANSLQVGAGSGDPTLQWSVSFMGKSWVVSLESYAASFVWIRGLMLAVISLGALFGAVKIVKGAFADAS